MSLCRGAWGYREPGGGRPLDHAGVQTLEHLLLGLEHLLLDPECLEQLLSLSGSHHRVRGQVWYVHVGSGGCRGE